MRGAVCFLCEGRFVVCGWGEWLEIETGQRVTIGALQGDHREPNTGGDSESRAWGGVTWASATFFKPLAPSLRAPREKPENNFSIQGRKLL